MRSNVIERELQAVAPAPAFAGIADDPLGRDLPGDGTVVTTRRSLVRLAFVAAETAARFEREKVAHDPMAWLLAPRRLFMGATALDACLERQACMRALLLHGLSLGLDAAPAGVDQLMDPEDLDDDAARDGGDRAGGTGGGGGGDGAGRRLFTAWSAGRGDAGHLQAFGAVVATSARAAAEALAHLRPGAARAGLRVVEGFDPGAPLAEALLSPAVADMLVQVAADPTSPLADGLEVFVEQRFAA